MSPTKPPAPPRATESLSSVLGIRASAAGDPRSAPVATGLGWITLAVAVITILLLVITAWPLLRLRSRPPAPIAAAGSDEKLVTEFTEAIDDDLAQIEGRSLFAVPAPPSPKKDVAKKSSPKPTRYGGPSVVGMINNQVWFSNGDRLGKGESQHGVKVVSLNAPWSAKLEWEGGEFDVDLFTRHQLVAASGDSRAAPPPLRRRRRARPHPRLRIRPRALHPCQPQAHRSNPQTLLRPDR